MPYTTVYVDNGKGLHKTGSGVITASEIFARAMQESRDEPRARMLRYGLVDFSEVTEMKITPNDIRQVVEMNRNLAALTPGALVAIVAPTPLPYAMARLWHTFSDDLGWKAFVFHNRPDAIAWLRKEILAKEGSSAALDEYPSLQLEP